jgi:hypothetical protein
MTFPPEAAFVRLPLKGAPLADRQSRLRGGLGWEIKKELHCGCR